MATSGYNFNFDRGALRQRAEKIKKEREERAANVRGKHMFLQQCPLGVTQLRILPPLRSEEGEFQLLPGGAVGKRTFKHWLPLMQEKNPGKKLPAIDCVEQTDPGRGIRCAICEVIEHIESVVDQDDIKRMTQIRGAYNAVVRGMWKPDGKQLLGVKGGKGEVVTVDTYLEVPGVIVELPPSASDAVESLFASHDVLFFHPTEGQDILVDHRQNDKGFHEYSISLAEGTAGPFCDEATLATYLDELPNLDQVYRTPDKWLGQARTVARRLLEWASQFGDFSDFRLSSIDLESEVQSRLGTPPPARQAPTTRPPIQPRLPQRQPSGPPAGVAAAPAAAAAAAAAAPAAGSAPPVMRPQATKPKPAPKPASAKAPEPQTTDVVAQPELREDGHPVCHGQVHARNPEFQESGVLSDPQCAVCSFSVVCDMG